jgi:hypothetical protein
LQDTIENGKDGMDGLDGVDGKNGIDGIDGKDGKNGITPHIGENGNWWIGERDTGVSVTGAKGDKGESGKNGTDGKNGENGKNGQTAPTPSCRYNYDTDHYEVSLDGGQSWSEVENYDPDAQAQED